MHFPVVVALPDASEVICLLVNNIVRNLQTDTTCSWRSTMVVLLFQMPARWSLLLGLSVLPRLPLWRQRPRTSPEVLHEVMTSSAEVTKRLALEETELEDGTNVR